MGLGFSGRLLGWGDIPESFDTLSLTRTPPGLFRRHSRVLPKTQPCPRISGVGRFLRKRHVCGAGPLGERSLPRRSSGDIGFVPGVVLWGCTMGLYYGVGILREASRVGRHPGILRHTQPHPNTSGVGRFLRKRHVCCAGPLGDRSLPGEIIRLHPRVLPKTQPCPRTSEVGRFLRKRHVCGAGPLGDRSLPRRSSGDIGVVAGSETLQATLERVLVPAEDTAQKAQGDVAGTIGDGAGRWEWEAFLHGPCESRPAGETATRRSTGRGP